MTDPIPGVGMHRTDDHRYYWMGEGPFVSVTTALKTYDKSDVLTGWAKRETAAFALRHLDTLIAHRGHNSPVPECPPCQKARRPFDRNRAAQTWVASISDYQRDTAADLGTEVHAIAEDIGSDKESEIKPELVPYAEQYQRFLYEWQPHLLAIEYMGLNTFYGYGGTGDIIARLTTSPRPSPLVGKTVAIDIKSWTKDEPIKDTYYPETGMQLAACSRFDFIGKPNDPFEYKMPAVEAFAVLLLGREDYRLIPYAVTDATFAAFVACLGLHQWRYGEAKTIVGEAA